MRGIDINGFELGDTLTKKKKINNRDVSFEGSPFPNNTNNNNEGQVHGSGSLVCKDVGGTHTMREEGGRSSTMSRGCLLEGMMRGDKQPSIGLTPFRSF